MGLLTATDRPLRTRERPDAGQGVRAAPRDVGGQDGWWWCHRTMRTEAFRSQTRTAHPDPRQEIGVIS
jgi:hypothetical protein